MAMISFLAASFRGLEPEAGNFPVADAAEYFGGIGDISPDVLTGSPCQLSRRSGRWELAVAAIAAC